MNKEKLIKKLKNQGYLETPLITEAFRKIYRKDFVPEERLELAYTNQALPLKKGQTISQPLTVAFMLEKLEPQPSEKIMDIGTGSGWQASLIAYIISKNEEKNKGKVITIERIPELVEIAKENISRYSFIEKNTLRMTQRGSAL
ncbi:MAG: protein-L-isoaspartate O-methyltransferase [Candidatus Magasanikbacteria bacterium]